MKDKKAKQDEQKKNASNKFEEKREKLKELDLENENERRKFIKKMKNMEKRKKEFDKKKEELYQRIKEENINHLKMARDKKNQLAKEENERREDILYYENYKFTLALEKEKGNRHKKQYSQIKTIENHKEAENKIKEFKKIMTSLQEDSVKNKTDKERRKMYNEKVKKEKEEKKKEEEKKLEKLGVI
jgi:hypothetical protein